MSWLGYWFTVAALAITFTAAIITLEMKNTKLKRQHEADLIQDELNKKMNEAMLRDNQKLRREIEEWKKRAEENSPYEAMIVRHRTGHVQRFAQQVYVSVDDIKMALFPEEIDSRYQRMMEHAREKLLNDITRGLRQFVHVTTVNNENGSIAVRGEIFVVVQDEQ